MLRQTQKAQFHKPESYFWWLHLRICIVLWRKYHFNTKSTLTIVYKTQRKAWRFRYFTVKYFWYITRLFLPPKQVSCSSPFPPKILHRYSIDSPSKRWSSDGQAMEQHRRKSGIRVEAKRFQTLCSQKFYMTRDKKRDFHAKRWGFFLAESFFLYIFALRNK